MIRIFLPLILTLLLGNVAAQGTAQRGRRAAPNTSAKLWNRNEPIPYILTGFSEDQKAFIRVILETMTSNTCLTFEENGPGKKLEYILVGYDRPCESLVGDRRAELPFESQQIRLKESCLNTRTVQHETMHALGFDHTQARTDRDDYITFNTASLGPNSKEYMKLRPDQSSTNYGIPYEYASIMHYETVSDIITKDPDYTTSVGGQYPIFNDWKMINVHYKCNETCPSQIECKNGGYQHPRVCTECVCPQFHTGKLCEEEKKVVKLESGGVHRLKYEFPLNKTTVNTFFNYTFIERSQPTLLKGPEGSRIRVTINGINDLEFRVGASSACPAHCSRKALEIVDGDLTAVGKRFCCNRQRGAPLPYTFVSKTNVVGFVVFARPGLDFAVDATFSIEGEPIPSETSPAIR